MSTGCYFATIVAGFTVEMLGLEMQLMASAVNSVFDYGSVFTDKVATLLIRALVPLSELDLVRECLVANVASDDHDGMLACCVVGMACP